MVKAANSEVDNSLTTISAAIQQRIGKADLTVDWLHRQREDSISPNALSGNSSHLAIALHPEILSYLRKAQSAIAR